MIKGHHDVKLIGLFGSESIGKTSTAYMLTGRLRTHGLLAEVVTDSSAAMPFPPDRFDTHPVAWMYVIMRKIERECEYALRSNVEILVSDRTPLDLLTYFRMKHPESDLVEAVDRLMKVWMSRYDLLYFFPAKGTEFRFDSFREPTDHSRCVVDGIFHDRLSSLHRWFGTKLRIAGGTYRERAEFVYHDILAELTGDTKPRRVVKQVRDILLQEASIAVEEVRMLGSRSVTRSHIASDTDDFDIIVSVPDNAVEVNDRVQSMKPYLESVCEATLDIKVATKETMPHEV